MSVRASTFGNCPPDGPTARRVRLQGLPVHRGSKSHGAARTWPRCRRRRDPDRPAGVDPALIVLHGNAKTTEEIRMAVDSGVGLVVVGPDDVDRLEAIVPREGLRTSWYGSFPA